MSTLVQIFPLHSEWAVRQAFGDYLTRCEHTMAQVFGRGGSEAVELRGWLFESAASSASMVDLMHTEPLYTVAEFLGVDEHTPAFDERVAKYQQLAVHHGWRPLLP
jgi:hypothetical protein